MRNKIFEMLKKELREVFRDKKSLSMMLIIPIMIPLIILGMSAVFEGTVNKDVSVYNKIGFAYELSDSELELTKSMNIDYVIDTEDKLKELFNNDEIYLYVTKTDNKYTLNYNSNTESGSYASIFMDSYFNNYKNILQQDLLLFLKSYIFLKMLRKSAYALVYLMLQVHFTVYYADLVP